MQVHYNSAFNYMTMIVVLLMLLNALGEYSSSVWEEMYQGWVVNNGIVSRAPTFNVENIVKCLVNGENYSRKEK